MTLPEDLHQSARACEGAAYALAHSLRPSATKDRHVATAVLDTYREAEAFAITCRAVMDKVTPIIPLLQENAPIIGRHPSVTASRVKNGFDSLIVILLTLFDTSNNAILDVAGNQSRWLVSPLQATAAFERMVMHHGQLRAMYGIIHLAAKIVNDAKICDTLFLDVNRKGAGQELEPAKWRAAIKMDDFYGRCFGFHYAPEMRNVLRVVNIARGSVHKSHAEDAPTPQLVKNVVMLGWGWIYSNMVIMDNLGLSIEGVSRIGADADRSMSIKELRKFMNLIEEPLVAGVSGLASPDVAIDTAFQISRPGTPGGAEVLDTEVDSDLLRTIFEGIKEPVSVRIMSHKNRPVDISTHRHNKSRQHKLGSKSTGQAENLSACQSGTEGNAAASPIWQTEERKRTQGGQGIVVSAVVERHGVVLRSEGDGQASSRKAGGSPNAARKVSQATSEKHSHSYLATTIKSELIKLQSNVSNFLGIEQAKSARGLIVHFHGGGFVSQSTTSHQACMKEWCTDIPDAVLFSVDYKLAPEHKFPTALYECVYAYIWALQNKARLGTDAERVVFAGDSAGGNLAVATALLINQLGLRGPDGICVGYPALYMNLAWSPSRLLSFFDPMLPLGVMELCVKSYLPDDEDSVFENAMLSPVLATADQLRKLPRMAIVCGSLDPLLDDSVLFAHRLRKVGRDWDVLRIYERMPHGFLNMSHVNVTARAGLRFLSKKIAEYADLPLRKGSHPEDEEGDDIDWTAARAAATMYDG